MLLPGGRAGASGSGVLRGIGEPVQIGRGVGDSIGVNTAFGATEGAAGSNGVGDAIAPRVEVETVRRRAPAS